MKKIFTDDSKLWKIMKMCAIQGMMAMVLFGVSIAHDNYGQLLDKKITLSIKETSLESALKEIELNANIRIFYSIDQLSLNENVSIDASEKPLRDVLDELLSPHNINYKVKEKERTVLLKKQPKFPDASEIRSKTARDVDLQQQMATIHGKVTDAVTQQPMAGVNVVIKGTTVGTTTDSDGNYSINADYGDVLVFSFIGYKTFETRTDGRTEINILLLEDIKSLNEVEVNAGYWVVKEKEQTGNISRVTSDEISKQPVINPLQALQGRMTGLYIQQASGVPGSNFTVRIRGQNSISGGNDPLYVIDGVPYISGTLSNNITALSILGSGGLSPMNSIDPNSIESVEVLKDADATAIYGSRGANGVILITTKKGKKGKTQLDLNIFTGASTVSRKMDLLNTQQYIAMRNEAFENDGRTPGQSDHDMNGNWDQSRYTDWQEAFIGGVARMTNAQLSISGGDDNSKFLFSGAYQKQGTVFPGDFDANRFSSHFSFVHTSKNGKFNASFSLSHVVNRTDLMNNDLTSLSLRLAPNAPALYDEQGNLNWQNSTWQNPLSYLETSYNEHTNNLIANTVLGYQLLPGLEFKTSFGINEIYTTEKNITPSTFYNPAWNPTPEWATLYLNTGNVKSLIVEPQLNWEKEIGKGKLSATFGATYQQRITDQLLQDAYDYTSDALIEDIDAAGTVEIRDYNYNEYKYNAAFCRINYNWQGKYIINATARRDGSSRFGPGKQFGNFGAIGAAWIFSNEEFIKDGSFLSFGKVRASYGSSGNDQIGDYRYLDTYSSGTAYNGVNELRPTRLFNADYSWEVNQKLEAALELGFIDDRILFSTSLYRNRSSNQLVDYPLARTTGFTGIQSNLAALVENRGLEIELTSINVNRGSFAWTTSINLTIPRNELISFPDLESSSYANTYVVGEPLTILKTFHYSGVNQQTGFYEFADMNGDGAVTSDDDQLAFIKRQQNYYGGFNNSLSYKGVQLDIFFQFVNQVGNSFWGSASSAPGQVNANQPIEVLDDRWQQPGDQATLQRYTSTFNRPFNMFTRSDAVATDASFIRLKNVYLSYQFPDRWTKNVKLNLYVQGQNLLTISKYFGMDPENTNSFILPSLRTFTAGLRVIL